MSVGWSRAEASDSVKRLAATWAWPSITFNSSIHTSTWEEGSNTTWVSNPTHESVNESMPCGHDTRNAPAASVDVARPQGHAITNTPGNFELEEACNT